MTHIELRAFQSLSFSEKKIKKLFSPPDGRYLSRYLAELIERNKKTYDFLGITCQISSEPKFIMTSSHYCGEAPLISPYNGKILAILVVKGRFGEDISSIPKYIHDVHILEYHEGLLLGFYSSVSSSLLNACAKFVELFLSLDNTTWRKFSSRERIETSPQGTTLWDKYFRYEFLPEKKLQFPNRKNILTTVHLEWKEILYVLQFAVEQIEKTSTKSIALSKIKKEIPGLRKIIIRDGISNVKQIRLKANDLPAISKLKQFANAVLDNRNRPSVAWRGDLSTLFERYVQHVFSIFSHLKGWKFLQNPRHNIKGTFPGWALKYLEPDMEIIGSGISYVIDAKYKTHLLNLNSSADLLKDSFREDLHQIVAYSALLQGNITKEAILVYPICEGEPKKYISSISTYQSPINFRLIGLPFKLNAADSEIINLIEKLDLYPPVEKA